MGFGSRPSDLATLKRDVDRALMKHFRFELLNRFDQIIHFTPLSREDVRAIALRALESIRQRVGFRRQQYRLEVDDVVLDWLTAHGFDPEHGARYLLRTVERYATTALAEAMVRSAAPPGTAIRLTVKRNRLMAALVGSSRERRARERVVLPMGKGEKARTLDRVHLLAEADSLLHSAARRLETLASNKAEAAELLDRINREGLWAGGGEAIDVIEKYRELDVVIQTGERLAGPLRELEAIRQEAQTTGYPLEALARAIEEAARAIREWDERLAESGTGAVWLLMSKVDPLLPATRWLTDVAAMELAWCVKLEFHAAVVACQYLDGDLARVALEVEGPGVGAILAMEHGIHRQVRKQASDLRVRVEVIPRRVRAVAPWPRIQHVKRRRGPFDIQLSLSAHLEVPDRGIVLDLLGEDEQTLGHLAADLQAYYTEEAPVSTSARIYGLEGSGARDPRTGASIARSKEVLRGDLDKLLDAWRAWQEAEG